MFTTPRNRNDSSARRTDLEEADPLVWLQENGRQRHRVHIVRLYPERVEGVLGVGLVLVRHFAVQLHLYGGEGGWGIRVRATRAP